MFGALRQRGSRCLAAVAVAVCLAAVECTKVAPQALAAATNFEAGRGWGVVDRDLAGSYSSI